MARYAFYVARFVHNSVDHCLEAIFFDISRLTGVAGREEKLWVLSAEPRYFPRVREAVSMRVKCLTGYFDDLGLELSFFYTDIS
jgi:hypothetical protein